MQRKLAIHGHQNMFQFMIDFSTIHKLHFQDNQAFLNIQNTISI
jgi:hypothetical protein